MTTPIQRRFRNQTLLLDTAATTPVMNVAAFLTEEDISGSGKRYIEVTADEYKTKLAGKVNSLNWAKGYFGQDLKPAKAVFIHIKSEDGGNTDTALNDAVESGAEFYALCYEKNAQGDVASQIKVAKWVQSHDLDMQCVLLTNDSNAPQSGQQNDIGYKCLDQKLDRTTVIYHPSGGAFDGQRPDAALLGRMLPTYPEIGGYFEQWDYKQVAMCSDSKLSSEQQSNLRKKGYNFVERFTNTSFTHVFPGRTATGREIRIQWGADWFDANVIASLANYAFRNPLMAYDDETFAAVESIYRDWLTRAVSRRLLTDYTINMPDPESIPAAVRATGKCNISDLYMGTLNSAIDEWSNTGKWSIGGV